MRQIVVEGWGVIAILSSWRQEQVEGGLLIRFDRSSPHPTQTSYPNVELPER